MLAQLIQGEVFAFLMILVRMAALISTMPAVGETSIPVRIKVALAGLLSLFLLPVVGPGIPPMPQSILVLAGLILLEIGIGLFVAFMVRLMTSALHVAGTIIAFQSGLAAAQGFDPLQGGQTALVGRFLTLFGVVLIFTLDLHLLIVRAMVHSYTLFPAGEIPFIGDVAASITEIVAGSFAMGLTLSAPFLVYGVVFNVALGLLARLMPQLPVFFVAMPANIFLSLIILMVILSAILMTFANYFENGLVRFLG